MKNHKLVTFVIGIILLSLATTSVRATNYYFSSSSGDDGRTFAQAQNPSTPWRSLARLNAIFSSLRPGDAVYLKRGDVFEGFINAVSSGNAGSPISIGAYGNGSNPVVSGLSALSGWTATDNNVWEAYAPQAPDNVNIVLLNGAAQSIGRYPNANAANGGYLTLESHAGNNSITDNQLSGYPNWTDGEVVIRKNHWVLDRNKITGHYGNTINYNSQSGYHASDNFGYFIQNHPKTLDQNGEWYYDKNRKRLGIYSTGGAPAGVEAGTVNTLVTITNQSYISFQNIIFKGANGNAFELSNAHHIQLLNCDILFSGANALLGLGSNYLTVEGCTISGTNNTALELRNSWYATIRGNKIKNTGMTPGLGGGDSGSYEGILIDGDNEVIEQNEIENTGYNSIGFRGNVNYIRNNFISNYNLVKDDGGGIYTWNNIAGAGPTYGSKITSNIVLDGKGAAAGTDDATSAAANGIYMDDNTAGVEITNNSVANCSLYGLYVHNGHELTIVNNTFYNSSRQIVLMHDNYAAYAPIRNITLTDNIFFSKENNQLIAEYRTPDNDITSFGNFSNNYYCRPGFENYIIGTAFLSNGLSIDLSEWKAQFGKDNGSKTFPGSATAYNHIRFEYNASAASKAVSLDGNYMDAKGAVYNSSITLAPFTSAVLVKQVTATAPCAGAGSINREQWNNTINGDISLVPWQTTPTKTTVLTGALEAGTISEAYGSRIRGYLCPPQSGNYTFWIAGDDMGELWLSTDESSANKRKIANLSGWTHFRDWYQNASQKSASIYLEAGRKYYLEVLHKQGAGGDHISVAWQLPDGQFEGPIPGIRLLPATAAVGVVPSLSNQTISFPALTPTTLGSGAVTLAATASSGLPVSYTIVSGQATLNNNLVTPTAAGTVVIKASQSGDKNFNPAPDVTQNLVVLPPPSAVVCSATGSILREQWDGIDGTDVNQIPVSTTPSSTGQLTAFEAPRNAGDRFGSRIRGYICPPQSGNYTFWIAGDDGTELWLSTDDNPSNKVKIAYNSSYTEFREWTKYSSQKSASIYLQAGQKYYVEALYKEANGNDHLSVAWDLPNGTREAPVAGSHLSPYTAATVSLVNQTISFALPATITLGGTPLSLSATASSGLPVSFSVISGPATLSGTALTATGIGTVAVRATQSGNAQYNAAPDVTQQLLVVAAATTVDCGATGSILREQWNNVDGNDVSQIPVSTTPSSSGQLTSFEGPVDFADRYGSRIRGYICPPQSGNYTFWIAGDDGTELWLSSTSSPSNKVKIAYCNSWTSFREWNKFSTQKSAAVYLQAGQKYYIEALQKEGGGGDHVSVAWQLPDGVFEGPISGSRLSPYVLTTSPLLNQTISFSALPTITLGSGPVTLLATASSGSPVSYSIVSGAATLNGNSVTATGAGTIVIKASQGGNALYNPAPDVVQNLVVTASSACMATGSILREQWNGIDGNDVVQIPLNTTPSSTSQLTAFEGPVDFADRYGSRIRGYVCPPQSGNYTFWIAGDDGTELWLSTDDNPSNKRKVAYSLSWTNYREWNKFASQKSVSIYLEGGHKYYIEALQKEGAGGDHVSVAWQLPDGVFEAPVSGSRLSPYTTNANTSGYRTTAAATETTIEGVAKPEVVIAEKNAAGITAFPNPFSSQTTVRVTPKESGYATVDVFDVSGRKLHNLFKGNMEKGVSRNFQFEKGSLATGTYFIRLGTATGTMNFKLVLRK